MSAKKKQNPSFSVAAPRPYTGFDQYAKATTPGLVALRDIILFLNAGKLTHLGSYGKRDMKGKPGLPSVHGTGRACDIGWTNRTDIEPVLDWLVTNADTLGIEMVADYFPTPWGRTWRCDRNAWKHYDKKTIAGAPGGRWIHLEISPAMANTPGAMTAALDKLFAPK